MHLTLRWYGEQDVVSLHHIGQIPGVAGIVTACLDVPVGQAWPSSRVEEQARLVEAAGLRWRVCESIPVSEAVKLGTEERDAHIEAWIETMAALAEVGVEVVVYNLMPVFDWTRTDLSARLPDGSTTLAYDPQALKQLLENGPGALPGWATAYSKAELASLRAAYASVSAGQLWENAAYFLRRVVPHAERLGLKLACHPDDPPWPVLGLPRIITSGAALDRLTRLVDSPANGITLCTGSLGADAVEAALLPETAASLLARGRVHFAHLRNVSVTAPQTFHETTHGGGTVDMAAVVRAFVRGGYDGPFRPDHGRMIWGEGEREGSRPGYGLYDRALGAAYLLGLRDATKGSASSVHDKTERS